MKRKIIIACILILVAIIGIFLGKLVAQNSNKKQDYLAAVENNSSQSQIINDASKFIGPAESLRLFIISCGDVQKMWDLMGPDARGIYKSPNRIDYSAFVEGVGEYRNANYRVVKEEIKGNNAIVEIAGDVVLEGYLYKDHHYIANMVLESGQWKWEYVYKKLVDVNKIVNRTPEEVEKVIGKPDYGYTPTSWHDVYGNYYPSKMAFYKNGLIDAFYIDNKLVRFSVDPKPPLGVDVKALESVGIYTDKTPTIKNSGRMTWYGLNGYYDVSVFPEYINIIADEKYK